MARAFDRACAPLVERLIESNAGRTRMASRINDEIARVHASLLAETPQHDILAKQRHLVTARYCRAVASLEYRHRIWPYTLLDFSRRCGELWEDMCGIAWNHPVSVGFERVDVPPAFADVRQTMMDRVFSLVADHENAGELVDLVAGFTSRLDNISMRTDQTFLFGGVPHVVDFKLSFNSNEKGNRNRISDTAWAYRQWDPRTVATIIVCSDRNNRYLDTLERQGWDVAVGRRAYDAIERFTGFPLLTLMSETVDFANDLSPEFIDFLGREGLTDYLSWLPTDA